MSTPEDFDHIRDLLSIIADPKKTEARLIEYRDLLKKNSDVLAALNKTHTEAEKKLNSAHEAEENAKGIAALNAAKERELSSRAIRIDERSRELDEKHRSLARLHDEHKEGVARKNAELDRRERAVAGLEAQQAKLAEDRKSFDEQMTQARKFLKV